MLRTLFAELRKLLEAGAQGIPVLADGALVVTRVLVQKARAGL